MPGMEVSQVARWSCWGKASIRLMRWLKTSMRKRLSSKASWWEERNSSTVRKAHPGLQTDRRSRGRCHNRPEGHGAQ